MTVTLTLTNMSSPKHYREYTIAEVAQLRELYPRTPNKALAIRFGRTVAAIAKAAARYGLKKQPRLWQNITKYHASKQQPQKLAA